MDFSFGNSCNASGCPYSSSESRYIRARSRTFELTALAVCLIGFVGFILVAWKLKTEAGGVPRTLFLALLAMICAPFYVALVRTPKFLYLLAPVIALFLMYPIAAPHGVIYSTDPIFNFSFTEDVLDSGFWVPGAGNAFARTYSFYPIGNVFVDIIAPKAGLKKGDFQEVRMDVNNMVAALASKTVDAMVAVEPYNEIAVAEGIGISIMDFSSVDKMPVFMAATPDFVQKNPDTVIAYLKAWQEVARDFKDNPGKVSDVIHSYFTSKGFTMSRETLTKALGRVEVSPGFPSGLEPDLRRDAEVLLREKKIEAIPDWKKALRPDLWAKAAA